MKYKLGEIVSAVFFFVDNDEHKNMRTILQTISGS